MTSSTHNARHRPGLQHSCHLHPDIYHAVRVQPGGGGVLVRLSGPPQCGGNGGAWGGLGLVVPQATQAPAHVVSAHRRGDRRRSILVHAGGRWMVTEGWTGSTITGCKRSASAPASSQGSENTSTRPSQSGSLAVQWRRTWCGVGRLGEP
jgi:hypothetical protein